MRKWHPAKLLFCVLAICASCARPAGDNGPADLAGNADWTYDQLRELSYRDPQRTFHLLDSVERAGDIRPLRADLLRANVYYYPVRDDEKATQYALKAYWQIDSLHDTPADRLATLDILCSVFSIREDFESGIRYATEGLQTAIRHNDLRFEGTFLFQTGRCMLRIGQRESGYRHLTMGIRALEQLGTAETLSTLSHAYGEMMCALSDDGRFAEAVREGHKREACIQRMAQHPTLFSPEEIDQQRAYLDAKMAHYLVCTGDIGEARRYEQLFQETAYASLPEGRILLVEYYEVSGQYQRVVDLFEEVNQLSISDTLTVNFIYYMRKRADALHQLGHDRDAYGLRVRADQICDTLYDVELSARAMALSEEYGSHYKDLQLEREHAVSLRRKWAVILLLLLTASALFLLLLQRQHGRALREKNKILIAELEKKLQYQEELRQIRTAAPERRPQAARAGAGGSAAGAILAGAAVSAELFTRLEEIMSREKLFLDSDLSRETILKRLHIDKNRLGQMFREAGGGYTLPSYINEKRLEYSLKMLHDHPNYTIENIAWESGFAGSRNFRALFKKRYGLTPTEFIRGLR